MIKICPTSFGTRYNFFILEFSDQAWCEAKSKSETTLPRVCTVPYLSSEVVSPTDAPAVRPNFDGYGQARRLDSGESDRNYNANKRARISRSRDEGDSRSRVNSRRRDSVSRDSAPRSRDKPSTKKSSTDEPSLDWLRLDHERLTLRAQAIANQRRVADNESTPAVASPSSDSKVTPESPVTPFNPPPSVNAPPLPRESSTQKPTVRPRGETLTPSALNLSEITISMSDLGSSQTDDSSAMDVDNADEVEDELLNGR